MTNTQLDQKIENLSAFAINMHNLVIDKIVILQMHNEKLTRHIRLLSKRLKQQEKLCKNIHRTRMF